jgi:hypothetical protein
VRALLDFDPTVGLGDAKFARMWAAFETVLRGGDTDTALAEATATGWVRPGVLRAWISQLKSAATRRTPGEETEGPFGVPFFSLSSGLRLVARPMAFRDETLPDVVDVFVEERRRVRFIRREDGMLAPASADPMELAPSSSTLFELRRRDDSLVEAREITVWDEDAETTVISSDDARVRVVLVDAAEQPMVDPPDVPVARYSDRWAVLVRPPRCRISVGDETLWSSEGFSAPPVDLRVDLAAPFTSDAAGVLRLAAPSPFQVLSVNVDGVELALAERGGEYIATGRCPTHGNPTGRVKIRLRGPECERKLRRRVVLQAGAWVRDASSWQRIDPAGEVDVSKITSHGVRLGTPGFVCADRAVLAGHFRSGQLRHGFVPLPRPLAYGEEMLAIDAFNGAQKDDAQRVRLCASVVERRLGTRIATGDGTFLILARPVELDPAAHWLVMWHGGGTLERLPIGLQAGRVDRIAVRSDVVVAALCSGSSVQAVAWRDVWSEQLGDPDRAHRAFLAIRAFQLPFLAQPHRDLILAAACTFPHLAARCWLARDPKYQCPSDALSALELDEGESWVRAVRELLEPAWTACLSDPRKAEAVFDELRRGRHAEDGSGADYHFVVRRLQIVGSANTAALLRALRFPRDAGQRGRLHRRLVADACNAADLISNAGKISMRRLRGLDLGLAREACGALRVSEQRFKDLLLVPPATFASRSANHEPSFRRAALRNALLDACDFNPPE